MKFNGTNYNGFVYIDDEKLSLKEAESKIRDWFFEQIEIESGLFSKIESVKKRAKAKWSFVDINETKELLKKIPVETMLDYGYPPSKAWNGIVRKYNLDDIVLVEGKIYRMSTGEKLI